MSDTCFRLGSVYKCIVTGYSGWRGHCW